MTEHQVRLLGEAEGRIATDYAAASDTDQSRYFAWLLTRRAAGDSVEFVGLDLGRFPD